MNAQIRTQDQIPLTTAFSLDLIVEDLTSAKDLPSPVLSPIDQDILNEEQAELNSRTGTVMEVIETLRMSKHTRRKVNHTEFLSWLGANEWPEEKVQINTEDGHQYMVKLFKGGNGFAIKTIPILDGKRMAPERAEYEINTLVRE